MLPPQRSTTRCYATASSRLFVAFLGLFLSDFFAFTSSVRFVWNCDAISCFDRFEWCHCFFGATVAFPSITSFITRSLIKFCDAFPDFFLRISYSQCFLVFFCRDPGFDPADLSHGGVSDVSSPQCSMSPNSNHNSMKATVKGEDGRLVSTHYSPNFSHHQHAAMLEVERQVVSASCAPVEISPHVLRSVSAPCGKMATSPTAAMDEHLRKNIDDRGLPPPPPSILLPPPHPHNAPCSIHQQALLCHNNSMFS